MTLFFETCDFIFETANLCFFLQLIFLYVSLNMHFEQEHTQKNEEFT